MGGYVEIESVPSGQWKAYTSGEGAFIVENNVTAPGIYHASAEDLSPVGR